MIALAILGVIAAFTIPKVLQSQQDGRLKSIAKEVAGSLSAAYTAYSVTNQPGNSTKATDLTPYLNYVRIDTVSIMDSDPYDATSSPCTNADPCYRLHNGALLYLPPTLSFGGTGTTNVVWALVDPDGVSTGKYDSIWFALYYNGRMTTWGKILTGTRDSSGVWLVQPTADPTWFTWD